MTTVYVIAALVLVLIIAAWWYTRWVYRRGKDAGQKELIHAIEEKISARDKKLFARLMRARDDDFGDVRNAGADWQDPTPKA